MIGCRRYPRYLTDFWHTTDTSLPVLRPLPSPCPAPFAIVLFGNSLDCCAMIVRYRRERDDNNASAAENGPGRDRRMSQPGQRERAGEGDGDLPGPVLSSAYLNIVMNVNNGTRRRPEGQTGHLPFSSQESAALESIDGECDERTGLMSGTVPLKFAIVSEIMRLL